MRATSTAQPLLDTKPSFFSQPSLLEQLRKLHQDVLVLKKQKWDIEENILKLENNLIELEKLSTKPYKKVDPSLETYLPLYFQKRIVEIQQRLKNLKTTPILPGQIYSQKYEEMIEIEITLDKYVEQYKAILIELETAEKTAHKHNKKMFKKLHEIRTETYNLKDKVDVTTIISEIDTNISLQILILILEEIKAKNEKNILTAYLAATQKNSSFNVMRKIWETAGVKITPDEKSSLAQKKNDSCKNASSYGKVMY